MLLSRSVEDLEQLLESKLVRRVLAGDIDLRLPLAGDRRRHDPEINIAHARRAHFFLGHRNVALVVRIPVSHVVVVRDHTRTGRKGKNFGAELQIHIRQQVGRNHRRLGKIRLEEIFLDEGRAIRDAFPGCAFAGEPQEIGVEIDTEAAGTEFLGCGDDEASVA
jgi:hypothetical protein